MQETCVRLMGKKLLVSLAMEGKFASDGLQAIDEGDDILMAMARELVTEKGIGESAAAIWRELQKQQEEVFGVRATDGPALDAKAEAEIEAASEVMVPPAVPQSSVVTQLLMFGASLESVPQRRKSPRRTPVAVPSDQLALF